MLTSSWGVAQVPSPEHVSRDTLRATCSGWVAEQRPVPGLRAGRQPLAAALVEGGRPPEIAVETGETRGVARAGAAISPRKAFQEPRQACSQPN